MLGISLSVVILHRLHVKIKIIFQGQCAYSDSITRKGCSASEVFKFDCPKVTDARHEHPRYPDPNGRY